MGIIRELSPAVINQIAAGEVVERPASVVKELLENAIDAGARRVELTVERGGKDLVRVADDGRGMDRDDLALAFRPHATSKLAAADDLHRVRTLGFRGEALAAIAEISRVRCRTRMADAPVGSEIEINGGEAEPIRDWGGPVGTTLEVRQLFFNTPVRRTFLKSDTTEAGHVADAFQRVALAHPDVHLTFRSGAKLIHDLPAGDGLRARIAAFFGTDLADALLWVESRVESVHLRGYVAHPEQSRTTARGQYLFVGGRFVRDRSLAHALTEAYRGLLMVGRQPVAFLAIDLPPDEVDVNVHPTKIEVRFRDGPRLYSQLLSSIRSTFLASDLHVRLQAAATTPSPAPAAPFALSPSAATPGGGAAPYELPALSPSRQEVASWFGAPASSSSSSPVKPVTGSIPMTREPQWSMNLPVPGPTTTPVAPFNELGDDTPVSSPSSNPGPVPEPQGVGSSSIEPAPAPASLPSARGGISKALQVHNSYLVAETDEGLIVIDQHALHERILFEEFRARVAHGGVEAQRLLVPEPVELTPSEAAEVLQRRDALACLGLEVEPFGGDTVLVHSVPAMLRDARPDTLLRDLAEQFHGSDLPTSPDAVLHDTLALLACKAAIKAGQPLSPDEITALLARRHLADDVHHCPHGRPTLLTLTRAELERQFGRTK
jgi:DNA mismatch repair protein MutL